MREGLGFRRRRCGRGERGLKKKEEGEGRKERGERWERGDGEGEGGAKGRGCIFLFFDC